MGADIIAVQGHCGIEQGFCLGKLVVIETQAGKIVQQRGVVVIEFQRLGEEFGGSPGVADLPIGVGHAMERLSQKSPVFRSRMFLIIALQESGGSGVMLLQRVGRGSLFLRKCTRGARQEESGHPELRFPCLRCRSQYPFTMTL